MKSIPEPKERESGFYDYFFKGQIVEHAKQSLDAPRWVRRVVGHPKQASNVNALDEVPDSSWYTNRHHLHPMSIEELVRGPNRGGPPDFAHATITKAKNSGVSPGFMLKDVKGQSYLIKLDNVNYPRLQSAAEVVSTKILYAAGYNVPENYVATIDPNELEIGDKVEITDHTGKKRALTRDDLDEMLRGAARMPDGRYRVMASKILPGKPKGPFPQVGLRIDDPNDLIPHEHRRELRGLRVIASWIDDWDLKEAQSLDMYVEEGGRKFLRHYLLDFGSSLGADTEPTEYYHGHEYGLDGRSILKEIFTLGAYTSAGEKRGLPVSSEVGLFRSGDFDPEGWKQTYPSVMFDNLTDQDAFWATRIILSFTEPELRGMVETGEYRDPKDIDYIVRTLMERRQILAGHWLRKVDALSKFNIRPANEGIALTFRDLMVDHKLALANSTAYTYQIKSPQYKSGKQTTSRTEIMIDRATLAAAIEGGRADSPMEVTIWTNRQNETFRPVTVVFEWSPAREAPTIRRISRG